MLKSSELQLTHECTFNSESTVVFWCSFYSCSSALYHWPIQSSSGVECQSGGHICKYIIHGVGNICEGSYKVNVIALWICALPKYSRPNGVSSNELDTTIAGWKEWLNNPLQLKALEDSAGESHHLSGTSLSHTHTGIQDNSTCIQDKTMLDNVATQPWSALQLMIQPPPQLPSPAKKKKPR